MGSKMVRLPSSGRLMRILGAIILPSTVLVSAFDPEIVSGGAIGPQVVCDHSIGNEAIFLLDEDDAGGFEGALNGLHILGPDKPPSRFKSYDCRVADPSSIAKIKQRPAD
jgi:hypothetical protein